MKKILCCLVCLSCILYCSCTKDGNGVERSSIGDNDTITIDPRSHNPQSVHVGELYYYCWGDHADVIYAKTNGVNNYSNYHGAIVIPNQIKHENHYSPVTRISEGAFEDCKYITSVDVGDSVTTIGKNAFNRCTSLETIVFGMSVKEIRHCFTLTKSITAIISYNHIPPSIEHSNFIYISEETPLYVPAGSGEAYQNSTWGQHLSNIIEI